MNVREIDAAAARQAGADVEQFAARWSPRAMSGQPVTLVELTQLFEAARWAPSCFNEQPWRFAYALRDTPEWAPMFATLVEGNQRWVARAGALVAVISRETFERNGRPAPTHGFDAGAAWMSMALQAQVIGLVAHGMRGFDEAALRAGLDVPGGFEAHAMIAIGRPGDVQELPESLREREHPSPRKPLDEIVFQGSFADLKEK